nr:MAG TPA: hypothetical protein [Bacteriophage sp.]
MEELDEIRKTYREREQEREERIRKLERQLTKIYDKLLSIDIEVKEIARQDKIKEIEIESKKLNREKSYLENSSEHRYDRVQEEMNFFNER